MAPTKASPQLESPLSHRHSPHHAFLRSLRTLRSSQRKRENVFASHKFTPSPLCTGKDSSHSLLKLPPKKRKRVVGLPSEASKVPLGFPQPPWGCHPLRRITVFLLIHGNPRRTSGFSRLGMSRGGLLSPTSFPWWSSHPSTGQKSPPQPRNVEGQPLNPPLGRRKGD